MVVFVRSLYPSIWTEIYPIFASEIYVQHIHIGYGNTLTIKVSMLLNENLVNKKELNGRSISFVF